MKLASQDSQICSSWRICYHYRHVVQSFNCRQISLCSEISLLRNSSYRISSSSASNSQQSGVWISLARLQLLVPLSSPCSCPSSAPVFQVMNWARNFQLQTRTTHLRFANRTLLLHSASHFLNQQLHLPIFLTMTTASTRRVTFTLARQIERHRTTSPHTRILLHNEIQ